MSELKNQRVIAAVKADPTLTAKQLAVMNGCSRQHVHAVLAREGLKAAEPVRFWAPDPDAPRRVASKITPASGPVTVNTCVAGSIGELLVAGDLMARGWKVFFPLFRAHSDLIAQSPDGETMRRIEVRSAKRYGKEVRFSKSAKDKCDHYALVLEGEPISYLPDI